MPSSHPSVLPGAQVPSLQTSPTVQTSPSSQLTTFGVWVQPVGLLQASSVQLFLSSQFSGEPGRHDALAHASATVHGLLSVQGAVLAT